MSEATQTEKKQAQKERKAYRAKKRKLFFKTLFSRKIVLVSAIVVLLIILIAIFADFLMPYNPNQISIPERNQGMSAAHWLGTDEYGRDLLSRVIAGSRVSLIVGLLAVIIACVIGTTQVGAVPLHGPPLHPANAEPDCGAAVSVTSEFRV